MANDATETASLRDDVGSPVVAEQSRPGPITNIAYVVGSVGLLSATTVETIAVAGRHIGFTILGSIELVQAAAVLSATSAMIIATAVGAHASVHIVTERLSEKTRAALARWTDVLGALLFGIIFAGSILIAIEMWSGFERTELLGIDLRWLRALWISGAMIVTLLFVRRATRSAQ